MTQEKPSHGRSHLRVLKPKVEIEQIGTPEEIFSSSSSLCADCYGRRPITSIAMYRTTLSGFKPLAVS